MARARRKDAEHQVAAPTPRPARPAPAPVLQLAPPRILHDPDPDLVDRIFEYIAAQLPELVGRRNVIEKAVREEFGTTRIYLRRSTTEQRSLATEVARLFNGRNATAVARELQISRATVYRLLKQPGRR